MKPTTELTKPFNQHVRRIKGSLRECLIVGTKMEGGTKYHHCIVWFTPKELLHAKAEKHAHDQWIRDDKLEEVRV